MSSLDLVLEKYRKHAFSERDKGARFEHLMQAYLLTDPKYSSRFSNVWLWNDFFGRQDFGGADTGIDLVAKTYLGDYWAIQCKCFQKDAIIDKPAVDTFLSTSSKEFRDEDLKSKKFYQRLWISTTNHWGPNATLAIENQVPPVTRINLSDLQDAPVDWEKLERGIHGDESRAAKKPVFPHIFEVVEAVNTHFKTQERGKLIMACGTGKTIASLKIAERETNKNGLILFLVPSIALLGQTLKEWTSQADEPINAICICSDPEVSKSKKKSEDEDVYSVVDLALPASTDKFDIIRQFEGIRRSNKKGMTVVFSTYQSIEVISDTQKSLMRKYDGFGEIDLIVCDEAHRTTGVTLKSEDSSAFVKVHDNDFLKSKKRLYMTATPRLYGDDAKSKAAEADAVLCSMDDKELYGDDIYRIGFGEAVEKGLLTDYKVLILTLSDSNIPPSVQKMIANENNEINSDDISKLIGCINAMSKQVLGDDGTIKATDPDPMRRAVAFCQSIKISKRITSTFNVASDEYITALPQEKKEQMVTIASKHVDGTMSAPERDELLSWLKSDSTDNECKVLTNVRCLSEGVDVPSLDSVLFLSARNSQVDVVQSVGRVMRRAPGKKYGYIIIPVIVPSNVEANKALDDNERYKVVWTVLNALRAHDDRFNATVNKIELNKHKPAQIVVGTVDTNFDKNGTAIKTDRDETNAERRELSQQLAIQFENLQHIVFARMVAKVGDRRYWEQWATNVADIAIRQKERINRLIADGNKHQQAFETFLEGLRKNINPSITQQEAVEMLSQHLITKPVFEALFEDYSFVKHNPISVSMQNMLDLLEEQAIEKDTETLQKFYESVKSRASGIDNAEGKQRIIIELYDKFFKAAFPKMVERLGIVYTPVEVVDFIIHSVDDVLKKEFGRSLSDENIHILDPFTGTGTFITRLLQSGLIKEEDMERKYRYELHANEIVLLAYYIATVNIENAFHDIFQGTGNGEKGTGISELGMGIVGNKEDYKNSNFNKSGNDNGHESRGNEDLFIQRPDSLAGSYELGGDDLSDNETFSKSGNVWTDKPDEESGSFDPSEHSGGKREEIEKGLSELPEHSPRLSDRVGNSNTYSYESTISNEGNHSTNIRENSNSREIIERSQKIPEPQSLIPSSHYIPFEGICLTDTFQLGESDDADRIFSEMFSKNSERVTKQMKAPLKVIIGNPPYSVGQKSANDNAQNQSYEKLDKRISDTYAALTDATNKNSLYDSYIKAFRWSTDRLGKDGGIICFVSNGAWLDGNSTDGFRKTIEKEFSSIYVFNLRGNQRTSGELSRKEGGKIFGSGSRTPIAITLLVKKGKENG